MGSLPPRKGGGFSRGCGCCVGQEGRGSLTLCYVTSRSDAECKGRQELSRGFAKWTYSPT